MGEHLHSILLSVHGLSAVVWVGLLFAMRLVVTPGLAGLDGATRQQAMRHILPILFRWVLVAVVLVLASGYLIIFQIHGGFRFVGVHVHLMNGTGLIMAVLAAIAFHGPVLRFRKAFDAGDPDRAGRMLLWVRRIVSINLVLGIVTVLVGTGGRVWPG